MLYSCTLVENIVELRGPIYYPSRSDGWQVISFVMTCVFFGGARLDVDEHYARKDKTGPTRTILRNCTFQYFDEARHLVFLLDTHGCDVPLDQPSHIHPRRHEVRLEDGDPALNGFSLRGFTFLEAFTLVQNHLKGDKLPWE
jgi:hypothetical protein